MQNGDLIKVRCMFEDNVKEYGYIVVTTPVKLINSLK